MSSVYGRKLTLSIFGESHGNEIGVTINGFPCGFSFDADYIDVQLKRRRPNALFGTSRTEADKYKIISGVFNGYTTGAPITVIFENNAMDTNVVNSGVCRPSQSDYAAYVKYKGFNDTRSGGHLSARLTLPFVFAGSLCLQFLKKKGIEIGAHILSVYNVSDDMFSDSTLNRKTLSMLNKGEAVTLNQIQAGSERADKDIYNTMIEIISQHKSIGDGIGGVIECAAIGVKPGLGEPFFNSLESDIAALLFSIPSIKGVEFGGGFALSKMKASESNDEFFLDGTDVKTKTNNSGGILGGISNGMPIVLRAAFKPVPSVNLQLDAYNLNTHSIIKHKTQTANDTCAVVRACPCVESALAIALLDHLLYD